MKGLQKYIKKHGRHFTVELAEKVICQRWSSEDVAKSAQKKVYYNVTSATLGDMVFLTNRAYEEKKWTKNTCIGFCLAVIGDYGVGEDTAFRIFLESVKEFDFTPYI